MGTAHSNASRVFVDDLHASGEVAGYSVTRSCALSDATGILDDGATTTVGHVSGAIKIPGLLTDGAGTLTAQAAAALGVEDALLVTIMPNATTVGQRAVIASCDATGLAVDAAATETLKISIEALPDGGIDWGLSLHAHSAETADADGASVDNGDATANGGVAALHVTAYSGLTDATVKIQHSTDGLSWDDLATFAAATATTCERVVVASGTTVNRYLRSTVDVTGTGSLTYVVAFARR